MPLPHDFRAIDPTVGRVVLVETNDRVLPSFAPKLSQSAERSLRDLGVVPMTGHSVVEITAEGVAIRGRNGESDHIAARTVIWSAGVTASPLAGLLAEACGAAVDLRAA